MRSLLSVIMWSMASSNSSILVMEKAILRWGDSILLIPVCIVAWNDKISKSLFQEEVEAIKILYMCLNMGRTYEGTNKIEPILNPHFLIYVTEVIFYSLLHNLKLL